MRPLEICHLRLRYTQTLHTSKPFPTPALPTLWERSHRAPCSRLWVAHPQQSPAQGVDTNEAVIDTIEGDSQEMTHSSSAIKPSGGPLTMVQPLVRHDGGQGLARDSLKKKSAEKRRLLARHRDFTHIEVLALIRHADCLGNSTPYLATPHTPAPLERLPCHLCLPVLLPSSPIHPCTRILQPHCLPPSPLSGGRSRSRAGPPPWLPGPRRA